MAVKNHLGEVQDHNYSATAAITGGQLVAMSGNRTMRPAQAGDVVAGWCPYDVAVGQDGPCYRARRVPVITAGAVVAGQQAIAGANGQAAARPAAAAAYTPTDVENAAKVCGHFETGGAGGTEQTLVLY